DAIDLVRVAGSDKPRDEHGHPGEHRADEDDDDEDNLPADADRRVADVADVMADHDVVDDPLQAGDDVLEHRRPRELPDGGNDRPFNQRSIIFRRFDSFSGHEDFRRRVYYTM